MAVRSEDLGLERQADDASRLYHGHEWQASLDAVESLSLAMVRWRVGGWRYSGVKIDEVTFLIAPGLGIRGIQVCCAIYAPRG